MHFLKADFTITFQKPTTMKVDSTKFEIYFYENIVLHPPYQ
jgi:hypothetical protein